MSSASVAPNFVPLTASVLFGGPTVFESAMPSVTLKFVLLVAVPPGVVTEIGPVVVTGTVASIWMSETTL